MDSPGWSAHGIFGDGSGFGGITVRVGVGAGEVQYNIGDPSETHHYSAIIMRAMAYQITTVSIVCSIVCSGAYQGNHGGSASLAFVRGIHTR